MGFIGCTKNSQKPALDTLHNTAILPYRIIVNSGNHGKNIRKWMCQLLILPLIATQDVIPRVSTSFPVYPKITFNGNMPPTVHLSVERTIACVPGVQYDPPLGDNLTERWKDKSFLCFLVSEGQVWWIPSLRYIYIYICVCVCVLSVQNENNGVNCFRIKI